MFLALLIFCGNSLSLVFCLFGVGMALGCGYPTAHMIISKSSPSASRGRLVLGAFAFQAVGAMCGIVIGALVLVISPSLNAWRWMYAPAPAARFGDHAGPLPDHRERQLADRARRARGGRGRARPTPASDTAQDLGTYGIGVLTPTILATALGGPGQGAQPRRHDHQRHPFGGGLGTHHRAADRWHIGRDRAGRWGS
jgi:MFS transporter, putative metabolite transport protein